MNEDKIYQLIEAAKMLAASYLKNDTNLAAESMLVEAGILVDKGGEYQFADYNFIPESLKETYNAVYEAYETVYDA